MTASLSSSSALFFTLFTLFALTAAQYTNPTGLDPNCERYVSSPGGSDSNNCLSGSACATVSRAFQTLPATCTGPASQAIYISGRVLGSSSADVIDTSLTNALFFVGQTSDAEINWGGLYQIRLGGAPVIVKDLIWSNAKGHGCLHIETTGFDFTPALNVYDSTFQDCTNTLSSTSDPAAGGILVEVSGAVSREVNFERVVIQRNSASGRTHTGGLELVTASYDSYIYPSFDTVSILDNSGGSTGGLRIGPTSTNVFGLVQGLFHVEGNSGVQETGGLHYSGGELAWAAGQPYTAAIRNNQGPDRDDANVKCGPGGASCLPCRGVALDGSSCAMSNNGGDTCYFKYNGLQAPVVYVSNDRSSSVLFHDESCVVPTEPCASFTGPGWYNTNQQPICPLNAVLNVEIGEGQFSHNDLRVPDGAHWIFRGQGKSKTVLQQAPLSTSRVITYGTAEFHDLSFVGASEVRTPHFWAIGNTASVTTTNVDFRDGTVPSGRNVAGAGIYAYSGSSVTLNNAVISGYSSDANAAGGPVRLFLGASLAANGVLITGNSARGGSAIVLQSGASLEITGDPLIITGNTDTDSIDLGSGSSVGAFFCEDCNLDPSVVYPDFQVYGNAGGNIACGASESWCQPCSSECSDSFASCAVYNTSCSTSDGCLVATYVEAGGVSTTCDTPASACGSLDDAWTQTVSLCSSSADAITSIVVSPSGGPVPMSIKLQDSNGWTVNVVGSSASVPAELAPTSGTPGFDLAGDLILENLVFEGNFYQGHSDAFISADSVELINTSVRECSSASNIVEGTSVIMTNSFITDGLAVNALSTGNLHMVNSSIEVGVPTALQLTGQGTGSDSLIRGFNGIDCSGACELNFNPTVAVYGAVGTNVDCNSITDKARCVPCAFTAREETPCLLSTSSGVCGDPDGRRMRTAYVDGSGSLGAACGITDPCPTLAGTGSPLAQTATENCPFGAELDIFVTGTVTDLASPVTVGRDVTVNIFGPATVGLDMDVSGAKEVNMHGILLSSPRITVTSGALNLFGSSIENCFDVCISTVDGLSKFTMDGGSFIGNAGSFDAISVPSEAIVHLKDVAFTITTSGFAINSDSKLLRLEGATTFSANARALNLGASPEVIDSTVSIQALPTATTVACNLGAETCITCGQYPTPCDCAIDTRLGQCANADGCASPNYIPISPTGDDINAANLCQDAPCLTIDPVVQYIQANVFCFEGSSITLALEHTVDPAATAPVLFYRGLDPGFFEGYNFKIKGQGAGVTELAMQLDGSSPPSPMYMISGASVTLEDISVRHCAVELDGNSALAPPRFTAVRTHFNGCGDVGGTVKATGIGVVTLDHSWISNMDWQGIYAGPGSEVSLISSVVRRSWKGMYVHEQATVSMTGSTAFIDNQDGAIFCDSGCDLTRLDSSTRITGYRPWDALGDGPIAFDPLNDPPVIECVDQTESLCLTCVSCGIAGRCVIPQTVGDSSIVVDGCDCPSYTPLAEVGDPACTIAFERGQAYATFETGVGYIRPHGQYDLFRYYDDVFGTIPMFINYYVNTAPRPLEDRITIYLEPGVHTLTSDLTLPAFSFVGLMGAGPDSILDLNGHHIVIPSGLDGAFIRSMTIRNGFSSGHGGCVDSLSSGQVEIHDVRFVGCSAGGNGGTLAVRGSASLRLLDVIIDESSAGGVGGAVYGTGSGTITAQHLATFDTDAGSTGGALHVDGGMEFSGFDVSITRTSSSGHGAAVLGSGPNTLVTISGLDVEDPSTQPPFAVVSGISGADLILTDASIVNSLAVGIHAEALLRIDGDSLVERHGGGGIRCFGSACVLDAGPGLYVYDNDVFNIDCANDAKGDCTAIAPGCGECVSLLGRCYLPALGYLGGNPDDEGCLIHAGLDTSFMPREEFMYVAVEGDNTANDCRDPKTPCATYSYAESVSSNNRVGVVFGPGVYDLNGFTQPANGVHLIGAGADETVLDFIIDGGPIAKYLDPETSNIIISGVSMIRAFSNFDGPAAAADRAGRYEISDTVIVAPVGGRGGAISCEGAAVFYLTNVVILQPTANNRGGAIYGSSGCTMVMENVYIETPYATGGSGNGGALYFSQSDVTMRNVTITFATADVSGGAMYIVSGSNVDWIGGSISSTSANVEGGIMYIDSSDVSLVDVQMDTSITSGSHSGISAKTSGDLTLGGTTSITNSNAVSGTGGLRVDGAVHVEIVGVDVVITGNTGPEADNVKCTSTAPNSDCPNLYECDECSSGFGLCWFDHIDADGARDLYGPTAGNCGCVSEALVGLPGCAPQDCPNTGTDLCFDNDWCSVADQGSTCCGNVFACPGGLCSEGGCIPLASLTRRALVVGGRPGGVAGIEQWLRSLDYGVVPVVIGSSPQAVGVDFDLVVVADGTEELGPGDWSHAAIVTILKDPRDVLILTEGSGSVWALNTAALLSSSVSDSGLSKTLSSTFRVDPWTSLVPTSLEDSLEPLSSGSAYTKLNGWSTTDDPTCGRLLSAADPSSVSGWNLYEVAAVRSSSSGDVPAVVAGLIDPEIGNGHVVIAGWRWGESVGTNGLRRVSSDTLLLESMLGYGGCASSAAQPMHRVDSPLIPTVRAPTACLPCSGTMPVSLASRPFVSRTACPLDDEGLQATEAGPLSENSFYATLRASPDHQYRLPGWFNPDSVNGAAVEWWMKVVSLDRYSGAEHVLFAAEDLFTVTLGGGSTLKFTSLTSIGATVVYPNVDGFVGEWVHYLVRFDLQAGALSVEVNGLAVGVAPWTPSSVVFDPALVAPPTPTTGQVAAHSLELRLVRAWRHSGRPSSSYGWSSLRDPGLSSDLVLQDLNPWATLFTSGGVSNQWVRDVRVSRSLQIRDGAGDISLTLGDYCGACSSNITLEFWLHPTARDAGSRTGDGNVFTLTAGPAGNSLELRVNDDDLVTNELWNVRIGTSGIYNVEDLSGSGLRTEYSHEFLPVHVTLELSASDLSLQRRWSDDPDSAGTLSTNTTAWAEAVSNWVLDFNTDGAYYDLWDLRIWSGVTPSVAGYTAVGDLPVSTPGLVAHYRIAGDDLWIGEMGHVENRVLPGVNDLVLVTQPPTLNVPGKLATVASAEGLVVGGLSGSVVLDLDDVPVRSATSEFTVETWLRRSANNDGGFIDPFMAVTDSLLSPSYGFHFGFNDDGGVSFCMTLTDSPFTDPLCAVAGLLYADLRFNEWTHLAGVWTGSAVEVYVNGALGDRQTVFDYTQGAREFATTNWGSGTELLIGATPGTLASQRSILSDARFWSRALEGRELGYFDASLDRLRLSSDPSLLFSYAGVASDPFHPYQVLDESSYGRHVVSWTSSDVGASAVPSLLATVFNGPKVLLSEIATSSEQKLIFTSDSSDGGVDLGVETSTPGVDVFACSSLGSTFTVEMWMTYREGTQSNVGLMSCNLGVGGGNDTYEWSLSLEDGRIQFEFTPAFLGVNQSIPTHVVLVGGSVAPERWTHIAAAWDGDVFNRATIYQDSIPVAVYTLPYGGEMRQVLGSPPAMTLGESTTGGVAHADFHHVHVWRRTLSSGELGHVRRGAAAVSGARGIFDPTPLALYSDVGGEREATGLELALAPGRVRVGPSVFVSLDDDRLSPAEGSVALDTSGRRRHRDLGGSFTSSTTPIVCGPSGAGPDCAQCSDCDGDGCSEIGCSSLRRWGGAALESAIPMRIAVLTPYPEIRRFLRGFFDSAGHTVYACDTAVDDTTTCPASTRELDVIIVADGTHDMGSQWSDWVRSRVVHLEVLLMTDGSGAEWVLEQQLLRDLLPEYGEAGAGSRCSTGHSCGYTGTTSFFWSSLSNPLRLHADKESSGVTGSSQRLRREIRVRDGTLDGLANDVLTALGIVSDEARQSEVLATFIDDDELVALAGGVPGVDGATGRILVFGWYWAWDMMAEANRQEAQLVLDALYYWTCPVSERLLEVQLGSTGLERRCRSCPSGTEAENSGLPLGTPGPTSQFDCLCGTNSLCGQSNVRVTQTATVVDLQRETAISLDDGSDPTPSQFRAASRSVPSTRRTWTIGSEDEGSVGVFVEVIPTDLDGGVSEQSVGLWQVNGELGSGAVSTGVVGVDSLTRAFAGSTAQLSLIVSADGTTPPLRASWSPILGCTGEVQEVVESGKHAGLFSTDLRLASGAPLEYQSLLQSERQGLSRARACSWHLGSFPGYSKYTIHEYGLRTSGTGGTDNSYFDTQGVAEFLESWTRNGTAEPLEEDSRTIEWIPQHTDFEFGWEAALVVPQDPLCGLTLGPNAGDGLVGETRDGDDDEIWTRLTNVAMEAWVHKDAWVSGVGASPETVRIALRPRGDFVNSIAEMKISVVADTHTVTWMRNGVEVLSCPMEGGYGWVHLSVSERGDRAAVISINQRVCGSVAISQPLVWGGGSGYTWAVERVEAETSTPLSVSNVRVWSSAELPFPIWAQPPRIVPALVKSPYQGRWFSSLLVHMPLTFGSLEDASQQAWNVSLVGGASHKICETRPPAFDPEMPAYSGDPNPSYSCGFIVQERFSLGTIPLGEDVTAISEPLKSWTISVWVKMSSCSSDGWLLSQRNGLAGFRLDCSNNQRRVSWDVGLVDGISGKSIRARGARQWAPNVVMPMDEWIALTGTWDGVTARLFVNDAIVGEQAVPADLGRAVIEPSEFYEAISVTVPNDVWGGSMSMLRVWNRSLTEDEVGFAWNAWAQDVDSSLLGAYTMGFSWSSTLSNWTAVDWLLEDPDLELPDLSRRLGSGARAGGVSPLGAFIEPFPPVQVYETCSVGPPLSATVPRDWCREGVCGEGGECVSRLDKTYDCECYEGYRGDECVDIDECAEAPAWTDACDVFEHTTNCTNLIGSYSCRCEVGYVGDPVNGLPCTAVEIPAAADETLTFVPLPPPSSLAPFAWGLVFFFGACGAAIVVLKNVGVLTPGLTAEEAADQKANGGGVAGTGPSGRSPAAPPGAVEVRKSDDGAGVWGRVRREMSKAKDSISRALSSVGASKGKKAPGVTDASATPAAPLTPPSTPGSAVPLIDSGAGVGVGSSDSGVGTGAAVASTSRRRSSGRKKGKKAAPPAVADVPAVSPELASELRRMKEELAAKDSELAAVRADLEAAKKTRAPAAPAPPAAPSASSSGRRRSRSGSRGKRRSSASRREVPVVNVIDGMIGGGVVDDGGRRRISAGSRGSRSRSPAKAQEEEAAKKVGHGGGLLGALRRLSTASKGGKDGGSGDRGLEKKGGSGNTLGVPGSSSGPRDASANSVISEGGSPPALADGKTKELSNSLKEIYKK